MPRTLSYFITILFVITIFPNCGTTPCGIATLDYGLIGFADQESQNIVLRKFEKNSNFTNKFDTIILQTQFTRSNDTLEIAINKSDELLLSQYDYEVYFPSASRVFRISNIVEEQSKIRHSIFNPTKEGCINKITQLTVNGEVSTTVRFNRIYLTK